MMKKTQIQNQTTNFDKEEESKRNEPPTVEYRNSTYQNNIEKPLTQEQKEN